MLLLCGPPSLLLLTLKLRFYDVQRVSLVSRQRYVKQHDDLLSSMHALWHAIFSVKVFVHSYYRHDMHWRHSCVSLLNLFWVVLI
jgi:hypothetical protein